MKKTNQYLLTPFAVFIAIVGVILMPLSKLGGVYAWPCGRIALTVSFFYVGCVIAEWMKGKLSRNWLVTIGITAILCFGQKYIYESAAQLYPYDHIYWYNRYLSSFDWLVYYLSFMLLGIIINSPYPILLRRPADDKPEGSMLWTYPFRSNPERFWKDLVSGTVCFVLYMVMSILPYVTDFYTAASKSLILSIRILSVIPWVGTLIYVYRCLMSEKISALTLKVPRLAMFVAGLCPGAIFLIITNFVYSRSILGILIVLPIMTYILSVMWRFSVRLLIGLYKLIINKDFGWKEIFIGR